MVLVLELLELLELLDCIIDVAAPIARWKPEDIQKIAKKLDTDPERIKRDNWIADAKKQHYRKYGERL